MKPNLEKLNNEFSGKAIIRYIDINKHKNLLKELNIDKVRIPTQVLFNSDGTPYKTDKSEVLGYKVIKDSEGRHILTLHDGDLTLSEMKEILEEMDIND